MPPQQGWYRLEDGTTRYWDGTQWVATATFDAATAATIPQAHSTLTNDSDAGTSGHAPPSLKLGRTKAMVSSGGKVLVGVALGALAVPILAMVVGMGIFLYVQNAHYTDAASETEKLIPLISLSAPVDYGYGNVGVTVKVTNNGDEPANYSVGIIAAAPNSEEALDTGWIRLDVVPAGATAEALVILHPGEVAYDIRVSEASRREINLDTPVPNS